MTETGELTQAYLDSAGTEVATTIDRAVDEAMTIRHRFPRAASSRGRQSLTTIDRAVGEAMTIRHRFPRAASTRGRQSLRSSL